MRNHTGRSSRGEFKNCSMLLFIRVLLEEGEAASPLPVWKGAFQTHVWARISAWIASSVA